LLERPVKGAGAPRGLQTRMGMAKHHPAAFDSQAGLQIGLKWELWSVFSRHRDGLGKLKQQPGWRGGRWEK